jgi:AraC family transcriptional regulator
MPQAFKEEFRGEILQSRNIGNFGVIEVTYAPNQVLPLHSHQHAYVSVALRGSYLEQSKDNTWKCTIGGTIFHAAGESHSNLFSDRGARLLVLEIQPRFLTQIADQGILTDRQNAITNPYCTHLALRLDQAIKHSDPLSALCAEGLGLELLSETLRPPYNEGKRTVPDWLRQVREILHDRYREHLTLTELAEAVHVHPVHLARAFRKRYQCCVGDFVRTLRVEAACRELLETDRPIADIAARTGFTDQSHLNRILKRHAGLSPGQFRKSRDGA